LESLLRDMKFLNSLRTNKKFAGYLLLILFTGYFISVTFFYHTHLVDGVTIVHSHPYKNHSGDIPVNHNHSEKGFLLIQFISNFIAIVILTYSGVTIFRNIVNFCILNKKRSRILNFCLISSNRPRAPTFLLHK